LFYSRRNSEIDDTELKKVISSFTPRILAEVYQPPTGNLNVTSNLDSSLSSVDTVVKFPIPVPPPPPYDGPAVYKPSSLFKEAPGYESDSDKISSTSLENCVGDAEQEMSRDNMNTEPLWYHENDKNS
jgi:hypothetical protein